MYAALWRVLPGPWWVRLIILIVAVAALLTVLVFFVFPVVGDLIAPQEVTVTE